MPKVKCINDEKHTNFLIINNKRRIFLYTAACNNGNNLHKLIVVDHQILKIAVCWCLQLWQSIELYINIVFKSNCINCTAGS